MSFIEEELNFLKGTIIDKINHYLSEDIIENFEFFLPNPLEENSLYTEKVKNLSLRERLIITLGISSYIYPEMLNIFYLAEQKSGKIINTFGGIRELFFKPTVQTALFIINEDDFNENIKNYLFFKPNHALFQNFLKPIKEFSFDSKLELQEEFLHEILTNTPYQYQYSEDFPASLYTTDETWDDLILPDRTRFYLQDIPVWMKHYNTIMQEDTYKKFTKGMKFLLHGEPGTGKSVCVALFGRDFGKPVYRIDLSQVVSKWVGETSKNMGKIFDIAKNKDWILFFDEGDALFGKRTENNSANDRYGNQEIAYLLQRMEEHKGIIFMATNKLPNMDKAFVRRFQVRVPFPIPDANTRYDIWCETFKDFPLEKVNLEYFAANVDNTGASIRAFGRYCKLWMIEKRLKKLNQNNLIELLQTHLEHEGKLWSPNR